MMFINRAMIKTLIIGSARFDTKELQKLALFLALISFVPFSRRDLSTSLLLSTFFISFIVLSFLNILFYIIQERGLLLQGY